MEENSGRINQKGNRVIEETITKKGAKCWYCKKSISKGNKAISIVKPNGKVRIRLCSEDCRNESELEGYGMKEREF